LDPNQNFEDRDEGPVVDIQTGPITTTITAADLVVEDDLKESEQREP
jgi:hypothetical protein